MAYVYLIKNLKTNQFYYGSRGANLLEPENDLWKCYFTSSKYVKELILKYGKETFEASVIFESVDFDECYWYEQKKIMESINDPLLLNRNYVDKNSGMKKFSTAGLKLGPLDIDHRKKISNSMIGKSKTIEHSLNISKSLTGKSKSMTTRSKMSEFQRSRPKMICEYCGLETNLLNYQNWHGENCRHSRPKG